MTNLVSSIFIFKTNCLQSTAHITIQYLTSNSIQVLISLTVLVTAALARPDQPPAGYAAPAYPDEAPKYTYSYSVQDDYTSNNYGATEDRDGYATSGSYYVALPDGRLQKVINILLKFLKYIINKIYFR